MSTLKARLTSAIKAMKFGGYPAISYGSPYGGYWSRGQVNYAQAIGDPLDNSIVAATIGWIGRTFPEAPLRVMHETIKGEEPVLNHPLTMKLRRPNPFDSGSLLWTPIMMSYILDGNAYLLKERTNGAGVLHYWFEPHWTMEPRWPADGSQFISHYDRRLNGATERWDVADVVHLRNGKDLHNTRKGLSPLKSLIREIYSDNAAIQYSAAMLSNYGTPGALISPANPDQTFSLETAAAIKQDWVEKTTGERRGEPMISLAPATINIPTFSPQQMNVRESQWTPEERVSAVIGVPAIVVGLGAGLQHGTFNNTQQAREAAYEGYLIPVKTSIAEQLTAQMLPDFSDDLTEFVEWDYAQVRALQEDATQVATRAGDMFAKGGIDRATFKTMVGLEPEDGDHGVYFLPRGGSFSSGAIAEPVSAITDKVMTDPVAAMNGHSADKVPAKAP